jgi:hypothetical protein
MRPHIIPVYFGVVLTAACGESGPHTVGSRADKPGGGRADAAVATDRSVQGDSDGGSATAEHGEVDASDIASGAGHGDVNTPDVDDSDVNASGDNDSGDQDSDGPGPHECQSKDVVLGPSPLSRLANQELNNSIEQLLPSSVPELPWLPSSREKAHWASPPTATDLERVLNLARAVAQELTSSREQGSWLADCDPTVRGEEECRKVLLEPLVERIFRRPLVDEDHAELTETFELGRELGGTFESGLRAVLEVALQGPEFLYLIERGTGQLAGSAVQLTGHETAARLAFLLTGAAPDAELRNIAAQGPLELATIETQARRLIADNKNQKAISRTLRDQLLPIQASAKPVLEWSSELAQAADEATLRFVESVTFQGAGTLDALLTQPTVWANAELATFYGYTIEGNAWQEMELDSSRAAGIFTQPAFLGATPQARPSPVMRGLYVLRNLLCVEPPSPGAFDVVLPEPPAGSTQRQQLEAITAPSPCFECHEVMNAVGFAFEHYDAVGRWRDEDNGEPIDASGVLTVTDAKGPFADAVELMNNIVDSQAANSCFVQRWLEHALRRELVPEDACFKAELTQGFQNERQIDELLIAVARDDHFRYRLAAELEP